ncbi:MAG: C-terminal processing protease CtpA/Prc [Planctomycetota bacterium]|jgi:C-terminal processing protease CtpA/Prc
MITSRLQSILIALALVVMTSCSSLKPKLAKESPPLADMEAPLDLQDEPDDEAARLKLERGSFSGIYVKEAAESVEDMFDEEGGNGVTVEVVVENSPGAEAKIKEGDILVEATPAGGETLELSWPSEWRQFELSTPPGTTVRLLLDRAGQDFETTIILEARVAPAARSRTTNFREAQKVGLVLRTATEVESRGAGLGPGAGAVVIGLSKASPWRYAGVQFKDVIVEADGVPVAHPQVLLESIQAKEEGDKMDLVIQRGNERLEVEVLLTARATEFERFSIPLLFSHESKGEVSDTSLLFGLFGLEETAAAWEMTILWFITFSGGDSDELEEVDS